MGSIGNLQEDGISWNTDIDHIRDTKDSIEKRLNILEHDLEQEDKDITKRLNTLQRDLNQLVQDIDIALEDEQDSNYEETGNSSEYAPLKDEITRLEKRAKKLKGRKPHDRDRDYWS